MIEKIKKWLEFNKDYKHDTCDYLRGYYHGMRNALNILEKEEGNGTKFR